MSDNKDKDNKDKEDICTKKDVEKYLELKSQISELEKRAKKYKDRIELFMNFKSKDKVSFDNIIVSRTLTTRTGLSKQNVPKDIFDKYCTKTSYYTYSFKK